MKNIITINDKKYFYDSEKDRLEFKDGTIYINGEIAEEVID